MIINASGGNSDAVMTVAQTLDSAKQLQARTNINALSASASAVLSANISDSAIITSKISASAVTSAKVADSAITSAKISAGAVITAKVADSAITSAKISAANVTRVKLNNDALYSPLVSISAATTLAIGHLGKTLYAPSASAETTYVLTVPQTSTALPVGFEVAICRPYATGILNVSFAKNNVILAGEGTIATAASVTVTPSELGNMFALKKIATDATNGDLWLVTGACEVAS